MQQKNTSKADILLVDDTPENLRLLSTALTQQGYKVRSVINGRMALMGARAATPDLVLLDICMPDMSGYEVCEKLKADPKTADVPVMFISALDEVVDKVKAFDVGGVDFITKPFHFEEVLARVENQLTIQILQRSLTELNTQLEARVTQRTQELQREVQERKRAQEKLLHLALHDPLTQLPNRGLLMDRLEASILRAQTQEEYAFAVMFLDCDRFKRVNDSLGHRVGDQLLIAVAQRLQQCLHQEDTLARMGGDEFAMLIENITEPEAVLAVAEQINYSLSLPFSVNGYEVFINASIGIVFSQEHFYQQLDPEFDPTQYNPRQYLDAEHLLRDADTAMYHAKALGKARYEVFNAKMHHRAMHLLQLENDLRRALENGEFHLNYQPIVCLETGQISGFEALVRWQHPQQGLIPPDTFIPAAEETGLIVDLGEWVLTTACHQLKAWHDAVITPAPLTMSVNLSVHQLTQTNLLEQLDEIVDITQVECRYLKLEVTESVLIDQPESMVRLLDVLKTRDIQISLDDFGTGYSSLSYLHRFPMDILKIDRSFIHPIKANRKNFDIVQAIIYLGQNLGMTSIAEGVEELEQVNCLRELGCNYGQGYYFSRPLTAEAAEVLLRENPQW
jgi:diguanylate cyclase (GGDEF)-like protein